MTEESKPTVFRLVPNERPEAVEDPDAAAKAHTLEMIDRYRAKAEQAGAICVAVVMVNADGSVTTSYAGGDMRPFALLGGIQYLAHRVTVEQIEPSPSR